MIENLLFSAICLCLVLIVSADVRARGEPELRKERVRRRN